MGKIFPDARFVGLIRHPAGTVASLHNTFHYPVGKAAEYWREMNSFMTRQGAALGSRFIACRYEDLVAETEPVTKSIMHWLGEEWSPRMLQHHTVQRERNAPRLSDGGTVAHDRVDARRAEQWLSNLTVSDQALIAETCDPLASLYGYSLESAAPADGALGFSGRGSVVQGVDLARRAATWQQATSATADAYLVMPDASLEELAERALRAEATLTRVRSRRAIRISESMRRAVRNRSLGDMREAARVLAGRK